MDPQGPYQTDMALALSFLKSLYPSNLDLPVTWTKKRPMEKMLPDNWLRTPVIWVKVCSVPSPTPLPLHHPFPSAPNNSGYHLPACLSPPGPREMEQT